MLSVTPSGHQEPTTGFAPASTGLQDRRLSQSSHVGKSKQECKESNPAWRFWRPLASQKHTPVVGKGDRRELNPHLLLHRQTCLPRTPRTPYCSERKERELNPQGRSARPASNRVPSPIGLPFRFIQRSRPGSPTTRIRTRNTSLEARHDVRFTIEP